MSKQHEELRKQRANRLADPSARTTAQLSVLPAASREEYMRSCVSLDLGNLVRCVIDSGVSPDTRVGGAAPPQLAAPPQQKTAAALKELLDG